MNTPFTHHETVTSSSPIVQAAFALAQKAHGRESGQMRGKGGLPYLVHPIMLYDLLVHFGETDEITLASALLHDAREDFPAYKNDPDAMRKELEEKLAASGIKDAAHIAHCINGICGELTNAREMTEGKGTWQVEHAGKISLPACKVKLFDQMASILDNIMMPDDPETSKGGTKWSYKALNVVKALAKERPQLSFERDMFKVLFTHNMKILNSDPEEATQLRDMFDWDAAVVKAHTLHEQTSVDVPIRGKALNTNHHLEKGVLQVAFDANGKVAEYACLCNPQGGKEDPRTQAAIALMGGLEESSMDRRVTIGSREVVDGYLVRVNKVKPPIEPYLFNGIARQAGAIDQAFAAQVIRQGQQFANDGVPRR